MIPAGYEGREQTLIKHTFLIKYLEGLAYKVLLGRSPIFNFVDAFAGPWRNSDNTNFTDTSFKQALDALDVVNNKLNELKFYPKIRFCFCEKDKKAFKELHEYSISHQEYEIKVIHGRFEDNLEEIRSFCSTGFTFSFIDPTGWKIESALIFNFLRTLNGEFLINFMSDHINRFSEFPLVRQSYVRLLADPKWKKKFNSLPEEWSNEERILFLLKKKIKDTGVANFVPDMPILDPKQNRVKMRLLLGTNHPDGLIVFRDVQKPVEKLEFSTRTQVQNKGLSSLFDQAGGLSELDQESEGIGSPKHREKAKNWIIEFLSNEGSTSFESIKIYILEHFSITMQQLNYLVKEMKEQGRITYQLPKGKRNPQNETIISLQNTLF